MIFRSSNQNRSQFSTNFNLLTMYPYNSTIYMRPAMELGIDLQTKGFFFPLR